MSEPVRIAGWELRELLRGVAFAAGRRRPDVAESLCAIHFHATDGRFHAMATDGARLAHMSCAIRAMPRLGLPFCSIRIEDAPALYEIGRSSTPVAIQWHPDGVEISGGQLDQPRTLAAAPNEGVPRKYATAPRIFPTEWVGELRGSANRWARHLARLCCVSLDGPNKVRVTASESGLEMADFDGSDRPMGRLGGAWRNGDVVAPRAVNRFYLLEAIASAPGEAAVIRFAADPTAPLNITTPEETAWACALMPLLVNESAASPALRLVQGGRPA